MKGLSEAYELQRNGQASPSHLGQENWDSSLICSATILRKNIPQDQPRPNAVVKTWQKDASRTQHACEWVLERSYHARVGGNAVTEKKTVRLSGLYWSQGALQIPPCPSQLFDLCGKGAFECIQLGGLYCAINGLGIFNGRLCLFGMN